MTALSAIFRLSKSALFSLLESHALQVEPTRELVENSARAHISLTWHRRHVALVGHTEATPLNFAFDDRAGVTVTGPFDLQLVRPDRRSGASVRFEADQDAAHYFPAPGFFKITKALIAALPKAFLVLLQSSADIVTFLRTKDSATAMRLRKSFGITPKEDRACIIPDDLLAAEPPTLTVQIEATIVIPVFNALSDLERLLPRLEGLKVPIIFVDDASDEPRVAAALQTFAKRQSNVDVITLGENQGFVAAANVGLNCSQGHVVLLNSDTLPPMGDWVGRLLEPIRKDSSIASVTPFSNNAEIISIPHHNTATDINIDLVDQIDSISKRISFLYATCELPTGIGFCMAMNRSFLDKIGGFDPVFGRGYGEEVDWCQKARHLGGRNVGLASLFVGHQGGASFGAQKQSLVQDASKKISTRYKNYDVDVQRWVHSAPAQAQSLALSLGWLGAVAENPVPVFIGHSMGGGAEAALQNEVTNALKTNPGAVILRVGGPSLWRIELKGNGFSLMGDTATNTMVIKLLAPLKHMHLVYSCGVGGRHPLDAANMITALFDHRCTLDVQIHDFFSVSPSWNLLDSSGCYRGVPDLATKDAAHSVPALEGQAPVTHAQWRARWSEIFFLADKVVVFSNAIGALITEAYPAIAPKIETRPHCLKDLPAPIQNEGKSVGVLGSLNQAKGASVVQHLSNGDFLSRKIVVLGEMDGAFSLNRPNVVHGPFAQNDIGKLAKKYDIGVWFIPSICPETFSFTIHEALATHLPVLAFPIGAQGEAVVKAQNGHPIQADPSEMQAIALAIENAFSNSD